jgi:hypothetical protein
MQLQDLGPLLDAWDIETFDKMQTGQLLNVLTRFEHPNDEVSIVLLLKLGNAGNILCNTQCM